ncbi:MAG TPA: hypothetical protein EYG08_10275 [Myxococcales bacterium]|nr:hypothetical protein [Myxococcales bacterium]
MSTQEALMVNTSPPAPSIENHRLAGRLRAVCWRFILILTLTGCSPVEGDSIAERDVGVAVGEHWAGLLEIEDSLERTAAIAQFMTTLGAADAAAIGEILTTRYRRHRSIDDLILWNAWSRLDPEAAMARALVVGSPMAESLRADVILEWASSDPHAALAAVGTKEPAVRRALVRGWYESGVPGLSEFVIGSDPSRAGQQLLANYAEELGADKGAQGVADWVDSMRDRTDLEPVIITHVHRKGVMAMASADVEAAIAYCDLHCDEPYGDSMRSRLADRLGLLGLGERAVRWLEGAVDANQVDRGRSARLAFRAWLRADRDDALGWADEALAKYGDQSWFLPLARMAISVHTRREPESALDWMGVFTDAQDREDALIRIVRRWLELDEKAAELWLETSPLSREARAKASTPQSIRGGSRTPRPASDPTP